MIVLYGAGTKSRTRDLLITNQLLYQLSYTGTAASYQANDLYYLPSGLLDARLVDRKAELLIALFEAGKFIQFFRVWQRTMPAKSNFFYSKGK